MKEVRVIGAGLSGLATAWYLCEAGVRPHVIEAAPGPGGLIATHRTPHGLVETAARGFTWSPRVGRIFEAMQLPPAFARDESRRRYIFRNGRPRRWPLSPIESVGTVARFGSAWIRSAVRPRADESVDVWGRRVFGPAATRWMLAPVLQGIYASPPDRLSALAIFGPGRRTRGKLVAPAGGMGELIVHLHDRLVRKSVTFEFDSPVDRVDPSVPTVICTSAPVAARLLAPHAPRLAAAIARIRMVSLMPVTAFFEPRADDLRGFGVLFPRGTVDALGVLFNADIFAGRSTVRSETWIYGDLSADALPRGDAAVRARVAADRLAYCGRADSPVSVHALPAPAELPVYDAEVLAAQAERHGLPPTIALAGNYLGRLGVAALLEEAAEAAQRLA